MSRNGTICAVVGMPAWLAFGACLAFSRSLSCAHARVRDGREKGHEGWSPVKAAERMLTHGHSNHHRSLSATDETSGQVAEDGGNVWSPNTDESSASVLIQSPSESRNEYCVASSSVASSGGAHEGLVPSAERAIASFYDHKFNHLEEMQGRQPAAASRLPGHSSLISENRRATADATSRTRQDAYSRAPDHSPDSAEHKGPRHEPARPLRPLSHLEQRQHQQQRPTMPQRAVRVEHWSLAEPQVGWRQSPTGAHSDQGLSFNSGSGRDLLTANETQFDDRVRSVVKTPMDYEQVLRHAQNIYGHDCRLASSSSGAGQRTRFSAA